MGSDRRAGAATPSSSVQTLAFSGSTFSATNIAHAQRGYREWPVVDQWMTAITSRSAIVEALRELKRRQRTVQQFRGPQGRRAPSPLDPPRAVRFG